MLQKGSNHSGRLFSLLVSYVEHWAGRALKCSLPLTDLPSVHSPFTNRMQDPQGPGPGSPRFGSIVGFWEGVRMPLFFVHSLWGSLGVAQESSMCSWASSLFCRHTKGDARWQVIVSSSPFCTSREGGIPSRSSSSKLGAYTLWEFSWMK